MKTIVIIGAGAGGTSTALSLAKLGHHVVLLEARREVGISVETKEEKRSQNYLKHIISLVNL